MPPQFFKLSKRLFKACPDEWIVTPNERLALEINRAYDAEQLGAGKRAWATPRVASIERFVAARAAESPAVTDGRRILTTEAELLLWQEVSERSDATLSDLAADAWRLAHAYRIGIDDNAFERTINGRTFRRWARRFRERLKLDGWITRAELADALAGIDEALHLVAFDVVTPQLIDLARRTEQAGGKVLRHNPLLMRKGPQKRVETTDRASEIHASAQWARHVLTRYPNARVGVVFPYLTDAYHAIAHAFEVEFDDAPGALNVSGGVPLAEQPIWRDAEHLLRLAVDEIGHPELLRLQHSPWLQLGKSFSVPGDSPEMLALRHLAKAGSAFGKLAHKAAKLPVRQSFGSWVRAFRALLVDAGWRPSDAGSVQYQAYASLSECLERYADLPLLPGISGGEALQALHRLLANRLFAPERPPAPLQVLGYLETAGLTFTHLWVAGLQDTAWPAAPTPNPLIPVALQRLHRVPRVDHPLEAEFAAAQTHRWRRAARYLVTSHALEDSEERHGCSSLVAACPPTDIGRLVPGFRSRRHPWLREAAVGELEPVSEKPGSRVRGTVTRGGTSLFRDQAQCPFRAWAIHRLGLSETRGPRDFPDAAERGTLLHEALFELYALDATPEGAGRIDVAIRLAVNRRLRRFPKIYRENERRRLRRLLERWLECEAERPDFRIAGRESKVEMTLPGFELHLRIDRIDRDPRTGAKAIIDYKTGHVAANRLLAERLLEPQLPLYALCDASVRATLYAQIDGDGARLKGLASEEIELRAPGVRTLSKTDWNGLSLRWRSQIESLAREFREGHAAVAPALGSVCGNCHLDSFCRVRAAPPATGSHQPGAGAAAAGSVPGNAK